MQHGNSNSFFKEVIKSIKDFEKYPEFAGEKTSKSIIYIIKIVIIFSLIMSSIFIFKFHNIQKEILNTFNEKIEDVKYENEQMYIKSKEERIDINNEDFFIIKLIINTDDIDDEKENKYKEELLNEKNAYVILKDKIIAKNVTNNTIQTYSYNELTKMGIESFDKNEIIDSFAGTTMVILYTIIFLLIYLYIGVAIFVFVMVYALIISLLGTITSIILKIPLKYGAVLNIAIHGSTLSIILNLAYMIVNLFTGFNIKYFDMMYIAVMYIYVITAILMIKADFIKNQIELSKILEEQEKIRDEYNNNNNDSSNNSTNDQENKIDNENSINNNKENSSDN